MKRVLAILLLAAALPALADGDVNAGAQKSAACTACHGAQGKSSVPLYPSLAGQNAAYLNHALQAYKKRRAQRRAGGGHEGVCGGIKRGRYGGSVGLLWIAETLGKGAGISRPRRCRYSSLTTTVPSSGWLKLAM
ncbi:c-type cytochrome [Pantoea tagorei]